MPQQSLATLGRDDLVLCAGTIPHASFAERLAAAQAGGFAGISLRVRDHTRARADGLSDADMRSMLGDHGVAVAEIEVLNAWRPGVRVGRSAPSADEVFAVAQAVGARSICVVEGPGEAPPVAELATIFGKLCDRAADAGLLLHFEFFPGSVLDLATAAAIVTMADRTNGGLTVDTWHLARTRDGDELLRTLPGSRIMALQLSDSPPVSEPEADYMTATMTRRLIPGDGALDLVAFLHAVRASGSDAPVGAEIWSETLAAEPPLVAARRVGDAMRTLLAAVRALD